MILAIRTKTIPASLAVYIKAFSFLFLLFPLLVRGLFLIKCSRKLKAELTN